MTTRGLILILLAAVAPGCTMIDGMKTDHRMRHYARNAWDRHETCYDDSPYEDEMKDGFMDGYLQFVYSGCTTPPKCLPDRFNKPRYQNCFGKGGIQAYQQGFQMGLGAASQDCAHGPPAGGKSCFSHSGRAGGTCRTGQCATSPCATGACPTGKCGSGTCATCAAGNPTLSPEAMWQSPPQGVEAFTPGASIQQPYNDVPVHEGQQPFPVPPAPIPSQTLPTPTTPTAIPEEKAPLPTPVPVKSTMLVPQGEFQGMNPLPRSYGRVVGPGQLLPVEDGVVEVEVTEDYQGQPTYQPAPEVAAPAAYPTTPVASPTATPPGWRPARTAYVGETY